MNAGATVGSWGSARGGRGPGTSTGLHSSFGPHGMSAGAAVDVFEAGRAFCASSFQWCVSRSFRSFLCCSRVSPGLPRGARDSGSQGWSAMLRHGSTLGSECSFCVCRQSVSLLSPCRMWPFRRERMRSLQYANKPISIVGKSSRFMQVQQQHKADKGECDPFVEILWFCGC